MYKCIYNWCTVALVSFPVTFNSELNGSQPFMKQYQNLSKLLVVYYLFQLPLTLLGRGGEK